MLTRCVFVFVVPHQQIAAYVNTYFHMPNFG